MQRAEYHATILDNGQIPLPGEIRNRLRLKPEQEIRVVIEVPRLGDIRHPPTGHPADRTENLTVGEEETGPITLGAIMDRAQSILRELADNAGTIMAELEPVRRSGMLEVMNRLAERIDRAGNADDLVTIANIVYGLTVEIPTFPPDDEPGEQYFRLKPAHDGNGCQRISEIRKRL